MGLTLFLFIVMAVLFFAGVFNFVLAAISLVKVGAHAIDVRQILRLYAYSVCGICVILFSVGFILTSKSLLSYAFGPKFSYNLETYYDYSTNPNYIDDYSIPNPTRTIDTRPIITVDGNKYYSPDKERTQDLLNGVILIFTSAFFLIAHSLILYRLNYKGVSFLGKLYHLDMLAVFSLLSLIFIPTAIYSVINYVIVAAPAAQYDYGRVIPGEYLSVAVVALILWVYYLVKIIVFYPILKK